MAEADAVATDWLSKLKEQAAALALWLKGRRRVAEREVIDGRPRFAKLSIDDSE